MKDLSAIVLAAGEGERLRPLTRHRPKPMLPAMTKPILERVFDELIEAGVTDLTVVVGYGRTRVQSYFGPTYRNVPLEYVTQDKQLGSGHALLAAQRVVDTPCLVVNGDQVVDRRIVRDVASAHSGSAATIGLIRHDETAKYGGVVLGSDGQVLEIVERPRDEQNYLLNAGVYVFESKAFDAIRAAEPHAGEHSLIDGLAGSIDSDTGVHGVVSEGMWMDATYPWDLLYVAETLLDETPTPDDTVADSAQIHESAILVGPVAIDADCVVGPGAVVGPSTCLGENVTVDANAVIEHSVIDADTRVGPAVSLRDCVTGRGVRIGAGSTVVGGPGDVPIVDTVHRDERLGAVLGDNVRDEGGVTYAPGSVVGSNAVVRVGSTVRGRIESDTEVQS